MITRRAAAQMLRRFPRPSLEIDWILPRFWVNGLDRVFWANPPLVFHNEVLPSQIEHGRLRSRSEQDRARFRNPLLVAIRLLAILRWGFVRKWAWLRVRRQDRSTQATSF